jgi:hypothetical protein
MRLHQNGGRSHRRVRQVPDEVLDGVSIFEFVLEIGVVEGDDSDFVALAPLHRRERYRARAGVGESRRFAATAASRNSPPRAIVARSSSGESRGSALNSASGRLSSRAFNFLGSFMGTPSRGEVGVGEPTDPARRLKGPVVYRAGFPAACIRAVRCTRNVCSLHACAPRTSIRVD